MISDITLGQYFPGNSPVHRLDPRFKIILTILFMVALFSARNIFVYAAMTLFTVLLILASRISLRVVLRGIRPLLFILLFTVILHVLMSTRTDGRLLIEWKWLTVYDMDFYRAGVMVLRIVLLVLGTSVLLSYTTTPISLTDAIEALLKPLSAIRVPVHEFAMMMTIALRFIPTMLEETEKIMNAQKARGADLSSGNPFKRIRAMIPVLIPLIVSAFQRALDLATAMECRCYRGSKGRTKLVKLTARPADAAALFLFAAVLAGVYLGNYYIPIGIRIG
ncbi:MAG: energy-coupling factor transporter transmembrane protein EcfT [Clostridia bacterium]|nr:energy-coupling factor transporter transmembrane protein EcfT [Clostridia bacterium]